MNKLTIQEVGEWLASNSLGAYVKAFSDAKIDGKALIAMNESSLKGLKVAPLFVKKILALIAPYQTALVPIEKWGVDDVKKWLLANKLESYAEAFSTNGIDGNALLSLSAADLESIGLTDGNVMYVFNEARDRLKAEQKALLEEKKGGIMG